MEKEKLIKCKVRFFEEYCGDYSKACDFLKSEYVPARCPLFSMVYLDIDKSNKRPGCYLRCPPCIEEYGLIKPGIHFQITGLPELAKQLQETVESINKTFRIAFENHLESSPPLNSKNHLLKK